MATNGMREVAQPLEQDTNTVKLTDPADDDEGGDDGGDGDGDADITADSGGGRRAPQAKATSGQRPKAGGRAERRDLWKENRELRTAVERQTGQLSQMTQTFQQQLAEIRREASAGRAPAPAAQGQAPAGPLQERIKTLAQASQSELQAMQSHHEAALHNPKLGRYDLTKYNEIQEQLLEARQEAAIESWLRKRGVDPDKREQRPEPVNPNAIAQRVAYAQIRDVITTEFPWVAGQGAEADRHRKALVRRIEYLTDGLGMPDTLPTHRQAASEVERDLQLAPRRAPARPRRDFVDISDENRASAGGRREVAIPSEMIEGSGLSKDQLRKAIFRE